VSGLEQSQNVLRLSWSTEDVDGRPLTASHARRPITAMKAIRHALDLLQRSQQPLLVIGAGANRKLTAKMLRAFVDKQGIPFISTQMGKGVVDEHHPLFLGNAALSGNDYPHRAIQLSDLILNVGHDLVVLILNDSAYGMVKWKQQAMKLKTYGLDFGNPDFVMYAQSYGANGHRLERSEDLIRLMTHCLNAKGVHVINMPVDYSDNDRILNEKIPERSRALEV
jgi:thiamine pyrophosphate-dependent acetolactate synthase large subunit-like protein